MEDFVIVPIFDTDGDITGRERVTFEVHPFGNMVQIINVDFTDAHEDDVNDFIRAWVDNIESITFKTK